MKLLKKAISMLAAMAMCAVFVVNSTEPAEVVNAVGAMRDMTSQEVVSDMGLGWNLGNSFDSYYSGQTMSASAVETAWGNPTITKELIQAIKAEGFKTIRIPVTWMNCLDSSNNIDSAFMSRVQEVVDYCINEGLYVILNVHHDGGDNGGWLRNAQNDYTGVSAKYQKIWQQIADNFKDYSDYLVFESMNEVTFNTSGNPTSDNYTTLNNLNQLFVDTVRASGSNNEKRHLLIAGYNTDTSMTCDNRFTVPTDPANRCIVSIHYYSPSTFCVAEAGASWGYASTWGTAAEQQALDADLDLLKTRFVDAGVPVIIGEYGVLTESVNGKDQSSIVAYLKAVAEGALKRGMCPVLWDSGNCGDMRFINRTSKTWNISALDSVYADLASQYSTGVTTPVVTSNTEDNSQKVALQTDEKGNLYIDLSPYVGRLITGVGFTIEGDTYNGNGGVLIGMIVYSDATTWGGAWKGVQAPFLGADNGQLTKYTFDADNEESVDPTQIMYDGQTMTFSINWTSPSSKKDTLSLGDEVVLYFDGAELITTTTTHVFDTSYEETVTAVVGTEDNEEDDIHRPTMRFDLSPYKGNKLIGVEFSMTGTHGDGKVGISYNLIDETAKDGVTWSFTECVFDAENTPVRVVFDQEVTDNISYDFLQFNVWWESDGKTYDDYSFSPDVKLYFAAPVVTTVETTAVTTTTETETTVTTVIDTETETTVTTTEDNPSTDTTIDPTLVTMYGDVNSDQRVNVSDVVQINMYLLNKAVNNLTDVQLANGDCARDGIIDSADSAIILNYVTMVVDYSQLGNPA
ncbi:MAG: cellulase family glycosylhydrolase [Porcipelethomonas sp.]